MVKCRSTPRDSMFECGGCHADGDLVPVGGAVQCMCNVTEKKCKYGDIPSTMAGEMLSVGNPDAKHVHNGQKFVLCRCRCWGGET